MYVSEGIMSTFTYGAPEVVAMEQQQQQYGTMGVGEPGTSAVAQWAPAVKDYSMPLHVDCSIEYELPDCAKPPQGIKVEPLLMIHPVYFRKLESMTRVPFVNNMPKSGALQEQPSTSRAVRQTRNQAGTSRGRPPAQKYDAGGVMQARVIRKPQLPVTSMGPPEVDLRQQNRRATTARNQQPGKQTSRQAKRYQGPIPLVQQFHPHLQMHSVINQQQSVNHLQPQFNPQLNLQPGPQIGMQLFSQQASQHIQPNPQNYFRQNSQNDALLNIDYGSYWSYSRPTATPLPAPVAVPPLELTAATNTQPSPNFAQQFEQFLSQQAQPAPQPVQQAQQEAGVQQNFSNVFNANFPPIGNSPVLSATEQELLLMVDEMFSKYPETTPPDEEDVMSLKLNNNGDKTFESDLRLHKVIDQEIAKTRLRDMFQSMQQKDMQAISPSVYSNFQKQTSHMMLDEARAFVPTLVGNKSFSFSEQTGALDCDNLSFNKIQGNLTTPPDFLLDAPLQQTNVFYVE